MKDIKLCPFCGFKPDIMVSINTGSATTYYIECPNSACLATLGKTQDNDGDDCGVFLSKESAVQTWNARLS